MGKKRSQENEISQIGWLLVKMTNKIATGRIAANQSAAFAIERQIATKTGQKSIMREWKAEGSKS